MINIVIKRRQQKRSSVELTSWYWVIKVNWSSESEDKKLCIKFLELQKIT